MNGFFNLDNPIIAGIYTLIYSVYLCLLWIVFSIPIFTLGASTSALYYTVKKVIRQEKSYISYEFLSSFKQNFKKATIVTIFSLIITFVFIVDIWYLKILFESGNKIGSAYILFEILLVFGLVFLVYVFSQIALFNNSLKKIITNAFILMFRHVFRSIAVVAIIGFGVVVVYLIPITILIMPVMCCWVISVLLDKVYQNYLI
jgi:uncharacterized membrane protein YesL